MSKPPSKTPAKAAPKPANDEMSMDELKGLVEIAKEQTKLVLAKIPVLGPLTWLLMQNATTKHTLLSELDWRIMPPLMADQVKLFMNDGTPAGFVTWAKLSPEVVARYKSPPHHLAPSDWKSGEQIWLIDIVAPFGGMKEVMQEVREKLFEGQPVNQLVPQMTGLAKTLTWPAVKGK